MNSFFDKYKQKVESAKELPFNESDWKEMEKKLDRKSSTIIPFWQYALPFLAGILLTGFSSWIYSHYLQSNKITNTNSEFTQSIHSDRPEIDTVYIEKPMYTSELKTKYIYIQKIDTIYTTSYVEGLIQELQTKDMELERSIGKINSLQYNLNQQSDKIKELAKQVHQFNTTTFKEDQKTNQQWIDTINTSTTSASIQSPYALPEIPIAVSLPIAADTMNAWQKFIYSIRIARVDLNMKAGIPLLLHPKIKNQLGYTAGIGINLINRSRVELQANMMYTKLFYEGFLMDDRLGIPIAKAPSSDYDFTKAEVKRPMLQFDIFAYYHLIKNKRWTPKIGLGLGYAIPFTASLSHDFTKSPIEYSIESKLKSGISNPYSLQLLGSFGYKVNPRLTANLYTNFHQKLRKNDWLSDRIDISIGMAYRIQ